MGAGWAGGTFGRIGQRARARARGWDALGEELGGVVVRAVRGDEMPQQKRGLGRGLGALIPTAPGPAGLESHASEPAGAPMAGSAAGVREQQADGTYFDEIAIGAITPNPRQPRQNFDEDALEEL